METVDQDELIKLVQDEAMKLPDWNIVVSGLAGRYPKSDSVNEFEENLRQGKDMVNDQDNARFTCGLWGLPPRAGRLNDLSRFDCEFFGYSNWEANYIDFQLRILYEVVYESILDSGLNPATLRGTNTGVFFGFHCNEFENVMADDPAFKSNGYYGQFAIKVAQYFDLRGITVTFDAACASGFVGLHNAVEAIKIGSCDRAIVCSCNIPIHPTGSFIFLQMQMLSPTGYSRFLDSRADGYVKSEACVSVLLQRKDIARRNYATIMASMTSVDGYKKEGITFPSYKSQEKLIRATKNLVGLSTNHIEYLEAHGTGTPAGDPQEAKAITNVYYPNDIDESDKSDSIIDRRVIGPLLVGSVKTNMGHSEAASGLCAMVKVSLMLENELIYAGLHYEKPNANIESLKDGRIKYVEETRPLIGKIVPLSCYGFGGSNVHVILRANEKPQIPQHEDNLESPRLIVMFGRSQQTLNLFFDQLLNKEGSYNKKNCLTDDFLYLVDSINANKIDRLMNYRGFLIVDRSTDKETSNGRELARSIGQCNLPRDPTTKHIQDTKEKKLHILLPGLGSQWPKMAAGLREFRKFWDTIERLDKILEPFKGEVNLIESLSDNLDADGMSMCNKFVTIVAYEIALINIIRCIKMNGIASIVGHSLGEISAAYGSGLFDEREAIVTAFRIGSILDANRDSISGEMVAIQMSQSEALELIKGYKTVRISCINGPESVTISGRHNEMNEICRKLDQDGSRFFKVIDNCFALHNEVIMDESIRCKLKDALLKVLHPLSSYDRSKTNWISSSVEAHVSNQANAEYFANAMCKQVDFLSATKQLEGNTVIYEIGPCGLFEGQMRLMDKKKFSYVKAMKMNTPIDEQQVSMLQSLGNLYLNGITFNLENLYTKHTIKDGDPLYIARRQTPSLSSLFKWHHEQEYFVPRYPMQFSKSSAKSEYPVDIVHDRDKYLTGHCIEGRCLFPATGYLFFIWRIVSFTKRKIYDSCFQNVENELVPIEFINVRLLRAVILGNRSVQLYFHYEEATGRFEVKEGGSIVAEGWARTPTENPNGLLYEGVRDLIKAQEPKPELSSDDIYKQFRVSGYDYGDTFQNIVEASGDGRYCKVKFNGHFVALTDNILQSIFLAVTQYAPSGGLFLPTRFEYVRFQPDIILAKMRESNMKFDRLDGSLSTLARREIMTKIMERETGNMQKGLEEASNETENIVQKEEEEIKEADCFFDTYCDPVTGIIVTDGIEMRGIKASPAPRRMDTNEVLLESYQFVKDHEEPIEDKYLTKFDSDIREYTRICDSMSVYLLKKLCGNRGENSEKIESMIQKADLATEDEIETYIKRNLVCIAGKDEINQDDEVIETENSKDKTETETEIDEYDIDKNGDKLLLSVLDKVQSERCATLYGNQLRIKDTVTENRSHLMRDMIQNAYMSERCMRPLVEVIIENCCQRKMKLKLLELNVDDGIIKDPLYQLFKSIEPTLSLDYTLAHPDIERLKGNKIISSSGNDIKTHSMKDIQSLFTERDLKDMDLIVYKDISCYSLPKQVIEKNGLAPVMDSLRNGIKPEGFLMLIMRKKLTLAERILLSLSEPQLVGLSRKDLDHLIEKGSESSAVAKVNGINKVLESRCDLMMEQANKNNLRCISIKSDYNGCLVMLFRNESKSLAVESETKKVSPIKPIILRITHENQDEIETWLSQLKENFKKESEKQDEGSNEAKERVKPKEPRMVWLCAIASKQRSVNGLIGMMQALRKELGASHLRCYYDQYTFKDQNEPIGLEQIEGCKKFQLAMERNLIWNCISEDGHFGSFRHFTINEYLSYADCACSNQLPMIVKGRDLDGNTMNQAKPAYVNNAARGDLSSFTWFEAPFRYLNADERKNLVNVAYSALNFRDIMLATGRLPLDAIPIRLAMCDCLLGLEFSGYDYENRRVMGMVFGRGIASQVICPEMSSIKMEIPDSLDMKEAATIPVVYATAIMALIYRGHMKAGESILIHAGSGGVGQAAIRLALHFGLEVFTTVGSEEKKKFLLQEFGDQEGNKLRDDHIFSSRDCKFERQILEATSGRGVDLILNSLADDKLQASVRSLANGGRFLEIGKYDMSTDARLELLNLNDNKTFHGILLDKLFDIDDIGVSFRNQLKCVLETMKDGLEKGYVKPIKYTMFEIYQIEEAFRFMATGKHIGKILIEINGDRSKTELPPLKCIPRFQLSSEKSYVVTGGLGGFGLELTKWLVNQGAKYILITSRSGIKNGYQRITLRRLESSGAKFSIVTYDTTTRNGVRKLLDEAVEMSPTREIGAVFHLAMILKDTLVENMSPEDFRKVCTPKIDTCEHLDSILSNELRHIQLDYFVAFSSVTSGKGNAGQSNYAYANSYIERICDRRRARGQHGLAIQWGAIGDVGVAFENLGGNNVVVGGTIPQRMPSCQATLSKLLCSPFSVCLSVLPVNRGEGGPGQKGDLVSAIFHVLGIKDSSKVSDAATLGELGLDSLMAVEIRQYIEREYDMTLNMQEIRALTIGKIREIGENGPSKKDMAAGGRDSGLDASSDGPRVVDSYGSQIGSGAGLPEGLPDSSGSISKMLNRNFIGSYKPQLRLPKRRYRLLNTCKHLEDGEFKLNGKVKSAMMETNGIKANGLTNGNKAKPIEQSSPTRPIFFIPPIHGSFKQLKQVCKYIDRPCIGLNWTRQLGRLKSVQEAVECYMEALENFDWSPYEETTVDCKDKGASNRNKIQVDLVGYSFGAMIAFELMLAIYKKKGKLNGMSRLAPGRLILLDGSPRQIEMSSELISSYDKDKKLKFSEKVDELLMVYMLSHARDKRNVNFLEIRDELVRLEVDEKIEFASKTLYEILNLNSAQSKQIKNGHGSRKLNILDCESSENEEEDEEDNAGVTSSDGEETEIVTEIEHAMEAFCRRYELVDKYKAKNILPGDCTLIRAEKIYFKGANEKYKDDLELGSVVDGNVELFIFPGDHESFLVNNQEKISKILSGASKSSIVNSKIDSNSRSNGRSIEGKQACY